MSTEQTSHKSISGGVTVNINRPQAAVSSQLHTPLVQKMPKEDNKDGAAPAGSPMAAVKRETSVLDPLAHIEPDANIMQADSVDVNTQQLSSPHNSRDSEVDIFLRKASISPLDIRSIVCSVAGLRLLARSNAWKHVVELSGQLIQSQDEVAERSLRNIAFRLRMIGLFRLKMFDELVQEAGAALTAEEARMSFKMGEGGLGIPGQGPYNSDSVIALHLLLVEAKAMSGRGEEALYQLYLMRKWLCDEISFSHQPNEQQSEYASDEVLWWRWRIQWCIVNTLVKQRQWRRSIQEMIAVLADIKKRRNRVIDSEHSNLSSSCLLCAEVVVLCRLSRTFLQTGAVNRAEEIANLARQQVNENPSLAESSVADHCVLARALILFAKDNYLEAVELFQTIMTNESRRREKETVESPDELLVPLQPSNPTSNVESANLLIHPFGGATEPEDSLFAVAANNFAICSLFLRRISSAVAKMEELIQGDPPGNLIDPVVFNLCTMYDLSCAPDISKEKKKCLQEVASIYHIDDIHWKSFRLN
mmetsp:Transcript_3725/g.5771  ORF Transcript_3725/g.5771 Transcript_3725/m.5771 type:complete len:533 (-) Transcript_3725:97-1695(-)